MWWCFPWDFNVFGGVHMTAPTNLSKAQPRFQKRTLLQYNAMNADVRASFQL